MEIRGEYSNGKKKRKKNLQNGLGSPISFDSFWPDRISEFHSSGFFFCFFFLLGIKFFPKCLQVCRIVHTSKITGPEVNSLNYADGCKTMKKKKKKKKIFAATRGSRTSKRFFTPKFKYCGIQIKSPSSNSKTSVESLLYFAFSCFTLLSLALLCFLLLYFALLCFTLLYFALLCFALLCFALLCFALLCFALPCYALLCLAMLCFALLCFAHQEIFNTAYWRDDDENPIACRLGVGRW